MQVVQGQGLVRDCALVQAAFGWDFSQTACAVQKTVPLQRQSADFWQRYQELRVRSRKRRHFGVDHFLAKTHQGRV